MINSDGDLEGKTQRKISKAEVQNETDHKGLYGAV